MGARISKMDEWQVTPTYNVLDETQSVTRPRKVPEKSARQTAFNTAVIGERIYEIIIKVLYATWDTPQGSKYWKQRVLAEYASE